MDDWYGTWLIDLGSTAKALRCSEGDMQPLVAYWHTHSWKWMSNEQLKQHRNCKTTPAHFGGLKDLHNIWPC